MDSLRVDPSDLINTSKDILDNMQAALPEMKNNISQVANIQSAQANEKPPDIVITGNQFNIREESDIGNVAKEVMRLITKETNQNSRIGGIALI